MMALCRRERTGKGGLVSTSLMANGVWSNGFLAQAMLCGAPFKLRPKREAALNALNNLYEAADGRWFMLAMVSEEKQWPGLVKAMERPDRSEEHTSELQSLMRISYAVFCLKKTKNTNQ